jgi:RimJ/RimL family protein N-acetyltransferase
MVTVVELRPLREDDFPRLIEAIPSADALLQWAGPGFEYPLTRDQLLAYVRSAGDSKQILAATDSAGEMIGMAELTILRQHDLGLIGRVLVLPAVRGRGFGTALMREVVRLGFDVLNLHRLQLAVFDFNQAAIRCYERIGFVREGLLREARKGSDGYWNIVQMGLLRSDRVG